MAKVGNVFRGLFKTIFTLVAIAGAAIAILCMFGSYYHVGMTVNDTNVFSIDFTGFALAFNQAPTITSDALQGAFDQVVANLEEGLGEISIVTLVAFILFILGAILMVFNLFTFKAGKGMAGIGGIFLIVAGVLAFLTITLGPDSLKDAESQFADADSMIGDFVTHGLGAGAITSGVFGIAGGVSGLVAAIFKLK